MSARGIIHAVGRQMPSHSNLPSSTRALARIGRVVHEKYKITRLLGVGGTATVYAAVHRNGLRVAIKYLHDHLATDPRVRQLFAREAYVANQIGHPAVVPVLDNDVDEEGCAFLIMPLLDGETLRARWERKGRSLPVIEMCVLMSDVLDALASAHARGIVHRDIKPDNLFVTNNGTIRILDFGIARRIDSDGSATLTGAMIGTPAFMPPEQALGNHRDIGPHSDCWAVGATIFALVSGEFVHTAENAAGQLAAAATQRARSLAVVAPAVPAPITRLVDRALAFDPVDRWPSAQAMREALLDAFEAVLGQPIADVVRQTREKIAAEIAPGKGNLEDQETAPSPGGPAPSDDSWHVSRRREPRLATEATARRTPFARRRLAAAAVALGAALAIGGIYAHFAPRNVESGPPSNVDTGRQGDFGFQAGRPPPGEAITAYNAGVQAWRDAAPGPALQHFEKAAKLDPAFAAAHLRIALVTFWPDTNSREHYQAAVQHRRNLSDADKDLLDAIEPLTRIPPSQRDTEKRLEALAAQRSRDPLILGLLAHTRIRMGKLQEAVDAIEPTIVSDPSIGNSWRMRGLALAWLDRTTEAEAAYKKCTEVAPSTTSCFAYLADIASNEGDCPLALQYAQRLVAVAPSSATAAQHLAQATYAMGGSTASAREIFAASWRPAGEPGDRAFQFHQEVALCLLSGDFDCVRARLREWKDNVAGAKDEESHMMFTRMSMFFEYEMGNDTAIAILGNEYQEHRTAWRPGSYFNHAIIPASVQYFTGVTTREEYHRQRDAWLKIEASREPLVFKSKGWAAAYARPIRDQQDAREALAVLPEYLPLPSSAARSLETDEAIGRAYLLIGDLENAERYLRRATRSCSALDNPFEHTWALLNYGKLLEEKGDIGGACNLYRQVVQRWSEGTTSRAARTRITSLKCSGASTKDLDASKD